MPRMARAVQFRVDNSAAHRALAVRTVLAIAGALISLLGIVLAAGGLLSPYDGSAFCAFAGIGLFVSGVLVAIGRRAGAWTFLVVFLATLSWSLRNVGDGSSLAHRLVGPAVLLAILTLLLPILCRWRPRQAAMAYALIMLVTVGVSVSSTPNGPLSRQTANVTRYVDTEAKEVLQWPAIGRPPFARASAQPTNVH